MADTPATDQTEVPAEASSPSKKENPEEDGTLAEVSGENPSPEVSGKHFDVKKWDAVSMWAWDIVVDNCAICRNHLMDPCVECQANPSATPTEECTVAWGVCNHAFHSHCISRWLKTRAVCPLDNKEWVFLRYGR